MRDIACAGYVAGGNCDWFAGKLTATSASASLGRAKVALQDRLNFANESGKYGSMLAFPLSSEQWDSGKMDTVMSITSRTLPWDVSGSNSSMFPGGRAMYNHFSVQLGLNTIHYGEDIRASENME